ncbi:MAG: hypothetical protein RRA35_13670, partial [Desulfomonilia bacterium]|nr:hypothetical protein [Desulfomonilia bacterium]
MGYLVPKYRDYLLLGSHIAERIVTRETRSQVEDLYDIRTSSERDAPRINGDVFAQLVRLETARLQEKHRYSICLQDPLILEFVQKNPDIDLLTFLTFILTHELLHVHRFSTGKADFFGDPEHEEVYVDSLTRIFITKHPVPGLNNVIALLDKIHATPVYDS